MKFKRIARISAVLLAALVLLSIMAVVPASAAGEVQQQPEPNLTLLPESATNFVGETHTVIATFTMGGQPGVSADVRFEIISGPHQGATADVTTGDDGSAQWSYIGTSTGTDTIKAAVIYLEQEDALTEADAPSDGPTPIELVSATATKTWIARPVPQLRLTPEDATNPVGTSHTLTATLVLPNSPKQEVAANAETIVRPQIMVHFEVIDGPHEGTEGDAPLGEDLTAEWCYNGTEAGTDTIKASISVRSEAVLDLESNEAYKTWEEEEEPVPPIPEIPTVAFLGMGLVAIAGFFGLRQMIAHRSVA